MDEMFRLFQIGQPMMTLLKRNSIVIALMAMTVAFESGASEYLKGAEHFAAFSHHGDDSNTGCAAADAADLAIGQAVTIVVLSKPQRLVKGLITSTSTSPCAEFAATDLVGPFYAVRLEGAGIEWGELGVLIGRPASSVRINGRNGVVKINERSYKFDECTSSEAVHLTVRLVGASRSKLVWHDYVYLGYDFEPTCTRKELVAIDSLTKLFNRSEPARTR